MLPAPPPDAFWITSLTTVVALAFWVWNCSCTPAVLPRVIVDGVAAAPRVRVPAMLFVRVRPVVPRETAPESVRLNVVPVALEAKNPLVMVMALATIRSAPDGARIGGA